MRFLLVALVGIGVGIGHAASVEAAGWAKLEGSYAITARNYLDPGAEERKDSHLRIQLQGSAARDLYRAMRSRDVVDECTKGLTRRQGEMRCTRHIQPERYSCDFAIDLARQRIEYGLAC